MQKPRVLFWLLSTWCCSVAGASLFDPSFKTGTGTDNLVEQVLPLADGKILICGGFTQYNGDAIPWIARLNEDGSRDRSFNPQVSYWVRHMAVQSDGKIVIAGFFKAVEGVSRNLVARLNPDGSLDRSFDPGRGAEEKIVPNDPQPITIFWVTLQPDGKILITGSFSKYNAESANAIARLNPDGSLDHTFQIGSGIDSWGRFILVQPNSQILLTGWFTSYNGQSHNRMVRLNSDGTIDSSFNTFFGDKTAIYTAALLSDGKYVVAGHSKNEEGLFHREMERLNPDGSVDQSFPATTNEKTESLFVQPDGKIVVGGYFWLANDQPRSHLARFNPDGTLDNDFVVKVDWLDSGYVWTVAPDRNGNILFSGGFSYVDGVYQRFLGRALSHPSSPSPPPTTPRLTNYKIDGENFFNVTLNSETGRKYTMEFRNLFNAEGWAGLPAVQGNGGTIVLKDSEKASVGSRCYRVRVE
jgi:uncharacterized delta-60 repeat protein